MFKRLFSCAIVFLFAWLGWLSLAHAADDFLEPDVAFKFSARMVDAKTAEVAYDIADGYYMYRDRFHFRADGAQLGEPQLPSGEIKFDETLQEKVETYHHRVAIRIPVDARNSFTLVSVGQGCAEKGLCYAPMESRAQLVSAGKDIGTENKTDDSSRSSAGPLQSRNLLTIVPLFIVLGLGLAMTPCVWPMYPILSFIILGEGQKVNRRRGFILSAAYSLGMATVYTALGVAAALAGSGLSAALQNAWILSGFALLMVLFSLSMFGVYQLQMPASVQAQLTAFSQKQKAGKLFGVFVMGAVSALIIGPCVTAPLAATLFYISQTRDTVIGGTALFSLASGMSIPLLLLGISAGTLLPRAGPWMDDVKRFFGVLMLGLAWWMISPLISAHVQMAGWAALCIAYGVFLLFRRGYGLTAKAIGLLFFAVGLVQAIGAATGARDALSPLSHRGNASANMKQFVRVRSSAELDAALAKSGGKPAMLDFYADWCVSCKEMERFTFSDAGVQKRFANMLLLQIDMTGNTDDDKVMLKRFNLFGPPGIIFFDGQGKERSGTRVIGYQDTQTFLQSLSAAGS